MTNKFGEFLLFFGKGKQMEITKDLNDEKMYSELVVNMLKCYKLTFYQTLEIVL